MPRDHDRADDEPAPSAVTTITIATTLMTIATTLTTIATTLMTIATTLMTIATTLMMNDDDGLQRRSRFVKT